MYWKVIAYPGGQWPAPHPGPLEQSGSNLETHGFLHPRKAVATLVKEVHVNNRVVHQVLSDPKKVDQRGNIVEGELGGWADTGQHQNLHANVRPGGARYRRLPT